MGKFKNMSKRKKKIAAKRHFEKQITTGLFCFTDLKYDKKSHLKIFNLTNNIFNTSKIITVFVDIGKNYETS